MALVKMKKVYLAGPQNKKDEVVLHLEKAGVLHVADLSEEIKEPPVELSAELAKVSRIIDQLKKIRNNSEKTPNFKEEGKTLELIETYEILVSKKNSTEQEINSLEKEKRQLAPWGDFSFKDLELLEKYGIFAKFLYTSFKDFDKIDTSFLEDAFWLKKVELKGAKNLGIIALFYKNIPEEIPFENAHLPSRSLSEIQNILDSKYKRIDEINDKLLRLTAYIPLFEKYKATLKSKYDRARVLGGALIDEDIFAISGFVPADKSEQISKNLKGLPVAVIFEDPAEDDDVPIAFKNNFLVAAFEPLIRMFTLPHYREPDPTILVAPFMGIFFGFCMGDGAYGIILFILATFLASKFKSQKAMLPLFRLLQVLGVTATIIGILMGQTFGVALPQLAWAKNISQYFPLSYVASKPSEFFALALYFGVGQLAVGFLIKLYVSIKKLDWQSVIATMGWIGILTFGYFAIGKHNTIWWLLIVSSIALFLFSSSSPNLLKRLGGGLWAIYNIFGLFGDVMSYARIFGLGMSSGIIAAVVNQMAMSLTSSLHGFGWVFAIMLLIFGHVFNFAMAMIGSMVHSARLNFLEYYGKFFEGGGKPYIPFGKTE